MTIVLGRGNRRQLITLPCGSGIAQYAKESPKEYQQALRTVCDLLNIR